MLDQYGQVHETGRDTHHTFSLVKLPTDDKIQQIACGGVWSYVLTVTGDVYRWGGLVKDENRKVNKLKDIPRLVSLIGGFGAVTGVTQTGGTNSPIINYYNYINIMSRYLMLIWFQMFGGTGIKVP